MIGDRNLLLNCDDCTLPSATSYITVVFEEMFRLFPRTRPGLW